MLTAPAQARPSKRPSDIFALINAAVAGAEFVITTVYEDAPDMSSQPTTYLLRLPSHLGMLPMTRQVAGPKLSTTGKQKPPTSRFGSALLHCPFLNRLKPLVMHPVHPDRTQCLAL